MSASRMLTEEKTAAAAIQWEFGMAYEMFISLHVLHEPDYYGIRASWAAGVRSRIPPAERKLLEEVYPLISAPLAWIHSLPAAPRDSITALWALKQIPPAERMIKLQRLDQPHEHGKGEETDKYDQFRTVLLRIADTRSWKPEDVEFFMKLWGKKHSIKKERLERALDWWSRPEELGEGFLSGLQAYYQAFFEEEEKRLEPILKAGLERAQELATRLTLEELFLELSQGIQLQDEFRASKFIIAPSFWTTPLIFFEKEDHNTVLFFFGARPAEMSAIPGETLPDGLVRSLKALADPTRLKILFYLSKESLSPSELARRLHLRAPTVTHHLKELRLASLVELKFKDDEKRYAIRRQGLESTFGNLNSFLNGNMTEEETVEE